VKNGFLPLLLLVTTACASQVPLSDSQPYAIVLGIAQDGGYPQAGCNRPDCAAAWRDPSLRRRVASLGIVDPGSGERWVIDATPDFPSQLRTLDEISRGAIPSILLTHAHIGHYVGLAHLGREVLGARGARVYAMPRMKEFLEKNGPWDQLVRLGNIAIETLEEGVVTRLGTRLTVTPLRVPHRDEYSETVAFIVRGPDRSLLWLPDIDKWEKWNRTLEAVLHSVDVAYVDGTFFDERELPGRDLSEIPHPTISETMRRLEALPAAGRAKVRFIHLNQSNPALRDPAIVRRRGFAVAVEGERVRL
jgi:pyrroloquinoline quinone biosynthesis protein B